MQILAWRMTDWLTCWVWCWSSSRACNALFLVQNILYLLTRDQGLFCSYSADSWLCLLTVVRRGDKGPAMLEVLPGLSDWPVLPDQSGILIPAPPSQGYIYHRPHLISKYLLLSFYLPLHHRGLVFLFHKWKVQLCKKYFIRCNFLWDHSKICLLDWVVLRLSCEILAIL